MRGLDKKAMRELLALKPNKREIVIKGLRSKLGLHTRTGILSYRYDVCPVCKDMGSTENNTKCNDCYIRHTCKAPFVDGFRNDTKQGVEYFSAMLTCLERLKKSGRTYVVGGLFDRSGGKPSGVVKKLSHLLGAEYTNGGTLGQLQSLSLSGFQTIFWMPSISNIENKIYPKKDRGAILVCSKVMRPGYTKFDSVSRIFKMHGNAVLEIRFNNNKYNFSLVDALGNIWCSEENLSKLVLGIDKLITWSAGTVRVGSGQADLVAPSVDLNPITKIAREVADQVENERGGRYFGNASTRCMAMFPSRRVNEVGAYVSARNIDKLRIE